MRDRSGRRKWRTSLDDEVVGLEHEISRMRRKSSRRSRTIGTAAGIRRSRVLQMRFGGPEKDIEQSRLGVEGEFHASMLRDGDG